MAVHRTTQHHTSIGSRIGALSVAAMLLFTVVGCVDNSRDTANRLLNDREKGNEAIRDCLADPVLVLRELFLKTDGFLRSDYTQAPRIAVVLRRSEAPSADALAEYLWERKLPYPLPGTIEMSYVAVCVPEEMVLLPKCIGAYALAAKGLLTPASAESLAPYLEDPRFMGDGNLTLGLIQLTMGHAHCTSQLPVLLKQLPRVRTYEMPVVILEALGLLGDGQAVGPIRALLETWKPKEYCDEGERILDFGPRALRALILLGDSMALDLFLTRCKEVPAQDLEAVLCLENLTGKHFGTDVETWLKWRRGDGAQFTLKPSETAALRREVDRAGELWLLCWYRTTGLMPERTPSCFSSIAEWKKLCEIIGDSN